MSAIRICEDCGEESSLLKAAGYCCGARHRYVWACNDCGARDTRKAEGWRQQRDQHSCGCVADTAKMKTRRRVKKTKSEKGTLWD